MFKFIRAKGPQATAERQKLQKELFSYRRTLQHGFPNKPTALAWDPTLRLLGIGTATGAIKVFGKPGVEFYGQNQNPIPVRKLVFLPNVGRVVSLYDDNSLHLWEVNRSSLVEVKTQALEGKLKKISAICVESAGKHLLLGTEGGNIYVLDLNTFSMAPDIIYQDVVMQNVPEDYKLNPGAVESVIEQPNSPNNILIGYNRGLLVLWNRVENVAVKTFISNQQLESLYWHEDGTSFTSSHNDGSYVTWEITNGEKPLSDPVTTYGPFPCKAIPKLLRRQLQGHPLIVFSGGLPRASYSDKYTVTAMHDSKHVVFDFTSKVIDFVLIDSKARDERALEEDGENERAALQGEPEALVVLLDEELVVIDLLSEDWKMMNLPYLVSLHASAVTCSQHVSDVPEDLWEQLREAGKAQTNNLYSNRSWPIDGGGLLCGMSIKYRREILLLGHEDGTVRFWDASGTTLTPIYKFNTARLFTGEDIVDETAQNQEEEEEDWPPFRKCGVFDPYSDDPRLAIKKVVLCPLSGTLVVAGTAGHVVIAKFDTEVLNSEVKVTTMNIVSDRDGFVWKGHDRLQVRQGEIHQARGFQANSILQLHPPAAVTCCALQADWGVVSAGTAHGLALYDYRKQKPIIVKCTLNPNDLTGAGDTPISRRKSFKKSLRESFRRLRKGRSTRRNAATSGGGTQTTNNPITSPPNRRLTNSTLQHGFPNKPTALAWDPTLRLLGIGTATGAIKVFGKPGVEFYGQNQNPIPVRKLVFLPNVGRVVSLYDDNSLHLWEVNRSSLVEVKTQALEGKLKKISAICVESAGKHLLLGTEGGNIYVLDLNTFSMAPDIIYQDVVMQNVPEDYKLNPGAVESVIEQPNSPNNILIGYNRGLLVLWNRVENVAVKTFISNQQLESLYWHEDGTSFTSSHNDGSYVTWEITNGEKPLSDPVTTYGPFPCKAIPKLLRRQLQGHPLIVFSGGLPRASYSDKYTVTAMHDSKHVVFDFTSKVIDFVLIDSKARDERALEEDGENERAALQGEPEALVVLLDEELVVIDLLSEDWKMMNLPYLVSLHASAVTCSQHVSDVPEDLWEQLREAGKAQTNNLYSNRSWPIDGGGLLCGMSIKYRREILLLGHEDGTVRFWDASGTTLTPIYKFNTARLFTGEDIVDETAQNQEEEEEDWPPFRKCGVFDPYSDDPRLAIKKVVLCPLSGTLVVAGTAGHVVIAKFDTEVLNSEVKVTTMNIVSDRDGFVWKGHDRLQVRQGEIHQARGFQANSILQLHPPAAVTCCALQADWGVVSAGTAHGLALYDYRKQKPIIVKCTLNPNDLTGAGDTPISRRKSFKKSLRESFRRLRKGRSTRRNAATSGGGTQTTNNPITSPPNRRLTNSTLQHGFPNKPTALAWDPTLRLLGIGTATGAIKVFGKPGVEFYGQNQNPIPVRKLVFLPNVGRVVSLYDDNSLHLWEVNRSSLVEVKTQALEGKLKKISAICVESAGKHLLLGTEGGNIYVLDLNTFSMAPDIIYQDVVMQNVPEDYKLNPGAVESVIEQPNSPNNILIGYNRGLLVLWNRVENVAVKTFISNQQLESLYWHEDGTSFTSSHNDGSYVTWEITNGEKPLSDPVTTYGPFPCKAIPKLLRRQLQGHPLIVFSGGLPRASYSDKYTVTAMHDSKHVVFDFTSKVIDFVLIDSKARDERALEEDGENERAALQGEPEALVVLLDEELVVIDLLSEDWKMMNLPYLVSLHASAVTCSQHVSDVPEDLWEQLREAGKAQTNNLYSNRSWPIDGGGLLCGMSIKYRREILLLGHEDGTVRFWDASGTTLTPIYKFNTARLFTGEDIVDETAQNQEEEEEDWPPFRKCGVFDPYSDDPRLAIKKVVLCPLSGTLVVAGTAGHVVIAKFDTEVLNSEVKVTTMNIVSDRDGFVWKGHDRLQVRQGEIHQARGFQANSILQLHPPAAVTCCALQADWGVVSAGTAHGLALYDYRKQKPIIVKCTLNPNDLTGAGDTPISRRKSFKKSLRESFRRLRKGRSTRRNAATSGGGTQTTNNPITSPPNRRLTNSAGEETPLEARPVERQVEARAVDDGLGSIVRCLYFARTFIVSVQNTTPTMWAGTNNGTIYVFTIVVPSSQKRDVDDVHCQLAKEIQLKHRAPVIGIAVLDGSSKPLPEPLEVEKELAPLPDTTQPHRVIIASEEQFKIFTLPSLKPFCKYKLTAHEGARVRRMNFGWFSCHLPDTNNQHTEVDLLCLTNIGDILVLSIPDLKRQLNAAAIRREDINGISSLVFTKTAEALYLHSSSELQRISLCATQSTTARCYLVLPKGARDESGIGDATSDAGIEGHVQADEQQENENPAPLVNGNVESKESSVADKNDELRENGDETLHNVTVSSSIGDITIDSVKDHLGTGDELSNRLSNLTVTKTVITTVTNDSGDAVTSSTSTTTTTANNQDTVLERALVDSSSRRLETRMVHITDSFIRAPLALVEDME
ncbi:uncharacterized protein LOC108736234 [Agrilus planipennis]|uniref:Uncharacterized protein LOC108736234 n=1 Tax=Agrilus planipennis TaxID=224129 RepID=A0A1W4WVL3_AGRPL|nr:uncharacterized protein LOC108736234 [Agrilus planipennis]